MRTITSILLLLLSGTFLITAACGDASENEPTTEAATNVQETGNPSIDGLTQKISDTPDDPDLYAERAMAFYENNAFDSAIDDLEMALSYDSTNVDYLHLLADVYMDYYKSRLALETMERAAELHPENIPTLLKLSEFQLILTQYEESLQTLDRIAKIDPQNAEAFFMLGMTLKEIGDTARAINSFQESVEIDPDLVDAWLNLGQLFASRDNPIAEKYFDNAIRIDSSIMALHAKAYYLANSKDDLDGALELYRTISRKDPQYEEAHFNSGLLYLDMDEPEKAKAQFDLTVQVDPTHVRAYYYRGLTAELQGNPAAAKNDYEQALRLAEDFEAAQEALERVNEALAELQ